MRVTSSQPHRERSVSTSPGPRPHTSDEGSAQSHGDGEEIRPARAPARVQIPRLGLGVKGHRSTRPANRGDSEACLKSEKFAAGQRQLGRLPSASGLQRGPGRVGRRHPADNPRAARADGRAGVGDAPSLPRLRRAYAGEPLPAPRGAASSSGRQATFRRRTLAATGGACAICGATEGVQAHHVHALEDGGDPQGAGVPLCRKHHAAAHRS
jgi:hypothetical protein